MSQRNLDLLVAVLASVVIVGLVHTPITFAVDNHGPRIASVTLQFYISPTDPNTIIYTVKFDALPNKVLPATVRIDVVVSYKLPDSSGFTLFYTNSAVVFSADNHAEATFYVPYQGEGNYFIEAYGYDAVTNEFLGFRQRDPILDWREGLPGIT